MVVHEGEREGMRVGSEGEGGNKGGEREREGMRVERGRGRE